MTTRWWLGGVVTTRDDDGISRLRDTYPHWEISRASRQWLATRERVLTEVEMSYGLRHVLAADTAGQLLEALAVQHMIEMDVSRELA